MADMSSSSARRLRTPQAAHPPGRRVALAAFAAIVVVGPLLFGAGDRISQVALLVLMAIGIWAQPPAVVAPSRWGNRLLIAFLGIMLFKEFAPAAWFGSTVWRTILTRDYKVEFPWTHHPEPSRALDALLAAGVGAIWFLWVRRLAAERENRPVIAWWIFGSAAIVAAVSFATHGMDPRAIYGLRYTPGWMGFGPFPNRNHTADFLAIGSVVGCGCVTWAGARKKWFAVPCGVGMLALTLLALLTTQSRGGLVAFGVGLVIYFCMVAAKVRNRKVLGIAAGVALLLVGLAMTAGAPVLARFHSAQSGADSNNMRRHVWKDAITIWKDAPLLGHGLDSFAGIFPIYQTVELENQVVLHPESSWLLWLTENGILPVLLAIAGLALFLKEQMPIVFARSRGFYLSAGGIAGFALVLVHGMFDVPANRWGTAGLALAALAMACPMRLGTRRVAEPRIAALIPLGIAAFWVLPFLFDAPEWSPLTLMRLIARDGASPASVSLPKLEATMRYFPLSPELHETVGIRQMQSLGLSKPALWQENLAIAARLEPSSWGIPESQARACQSVAPGLAVHYWEMAVERGGIHRGEVLQLAVHESVEASPTAEASWGRYAEANPKLLLPFAALVPEAEARYYFTVWWKERAFSDSLTPEEVAAYYRDAPRWGTRAQFDDWMTRHANWRTRDYHQWAALLHAWADDRLAWQILSEFVSEPDLPKNQPKMALDQLEIKWRIAPNNFVIAQELAMARYLAGNAKGGDEVIVAAALEEGSPLWFVHKAGYVLARNGRFGEAVALLLRAPPKQ
jgi:O-antigen ligase